MLNIRKHLSGRFLASVLAATIWVLPASSFAYDNGAKPTSGEVMADALLVRPVMLIGTLLTTATFVVTLPFSALGGNVGEAADTLVVEPATYTFVRPLGEM